VNSVDVKDDGLDDDDIHCDTCDNDDDVGNNFCDTFEVGIEVVVVVVTLFGGFAGGIIFNDDGGDITVRCDVLKVLGSVTTEGLDCIW